MKSKMKLILLVMLMMVPVNISAISNPFGEFNLVLLKNALFMWALLVWGGGGGVVKACLVCCTFLSTSKWPISCFRGDQMFRTLARIICALFKSFLQCQKKKQASMHILIAGRMQSADHMCVRASIKRAEIASKKCTMVPV